MKPFKLYGDVEIRLRTEPDYSNNPNNLSLYCDVFYTKTLSNNYNYNYHTSYFKTGDNSLIKVNNINNLPIYVFNFNIFEYKDFENKNDKIGIIRIKNYLIECSKVIYYDGFSFKIDDIKSVVNNNDIPILLYKLMNDTNFLKKYNIKRKLNKKIEKKLKKFEEEFTEEIKNGKNEKNEEENEEKYDKNILTKQSYSYNNNNDYVENLDYIGTDYYIKSDFYKVLKKNIKNNFRDRDFLLSSKYVNDINETTNRLDDKLNEQRDILGKVEYAACEMAQNQIEDMAGRIDELEEKNKKLEEIIKKLYEKLNL